jgi:hypothetical protein
MHHMLPHLRSEAYPMYRKSWYPSGAHTNLADVNTSAQEALTDQAKRSARILRGQEASPSENIDSLVQKMDLDQTER